MPCFGTHRGKFGADNLDGKIPSGGGIREGFELIRVGGSVINHVGLLKNSLLVKEFSRANEIQGLFKSTRAFKSW
jgi:hypothetical protein